MKCKGLFFRYTESQYLSKHNSIEGRKSLRILKSLSCKGCSDCEHIFEGIREDIENSSNSYLDGLKEYGTYKLKLNGSYDYEYGWDNWEFEIIEVQI